MLTSIYLKDFRRHATLSMQLVSGLNGLFGANYAGKTSVLLAVAVGLGGAGVAARGWRLIRRGATNFEIQLGLHLAGKDYRVLRTPSGAKLWCGDKLLATGHGPVNGELSALIGMPVARWIELRFVRQKAAAAMFEAGAAKLNQLVEELTGVTTVSRVIQQLQKRADQAKQTAEALREVAASEGEIRTVAERVAATEARVAAAAELQKDLPEQQANLQAAIAAAAERHRDASRGLRYTHRLLDAHESFDREYSRLSARRQELVDGLGKLDSADLPKLVEAAQADQDDWAEWVTKMAMADTALAAAQAELAKLPAADTAAARAALEAAQAEVAAKTEAWEHNAKLVDGLGHQLKQAKQVVEVLREQLDNGICRACSRPFEGQTDEHRAALQAELGDAVKALGELQGTLGAAEADGATVRSQLKSAKTRLKAAEEENLRMAGADGKRQTLIDGLEQLKSQRDALVEAAQGCDQAQGRVQLAECKAEVGRLSALLKLAEKLAEVEAQLAALHEPDGEQAELAAQAQSLQQLVNDLLNEERKLTTELAQVQAKASSLDDELKGLQRQLDSDNAWLTCQDDLVIKLAEAGRLQASSGELVKYLRASRSRYLANAWELVMGRASSFAEAVTNGAISGLLRTEDGQFKFMEGGEEAGVDEASGAQAAILGLGVQIALAETLPTHLDLLLVDEPTADMDAEHSAAAVLALSTCAKQVMAISHHRMDESLCNQATEL